MLRLTIVLIGLGLALSPARAAVTIRVDKTHQTMEVTTPTGQTYDWKISSGRMGYRTPNGTFRPQRLERFWRSRKYDDAPMPHAIFFHGGYAIHGTTATGHLGRPASHGCIRLSPSHAATLFALVKAHRGDTRIIVTGDASLAKQRVEKRTSRRPAPGPYRGYGYEVDEPPYGYWHGPEGGYDEVYPYYP